jgi:hypothetical protein
MVATGGFGTLPDNPITNTLQEEIGKNVPDEILDPVNSYLGQLSAPTIPPQPASQPNPPLDLIGFFLGETASTVETPNPGNQLSNDETVTVTASLIQKETATATRITGTASAGPTETLTPKITSTSTPILTPTSSCLTPSTTFVDVTFFNSSSQIIDIYWVDFSCNLVFYNTLNPGQSYVQGTYIGHVWWFIDSSTSHLMATHIISSAGEIIDVSTGATSSITATPTLNATNTPTAAPITPTLITPAAPFNGFNISTVNLNGGGTSVTVLAGYPVVVTYSYQVVSDSCPLCITQLVTGLGAPGSHGGSCAYNGIPGVSPGAFGSENVTLTAPSTPGTYYVTVEYHWQYTCGDALTLYGTGGGAPQFIGQIIVQ